MSGNVKITENVHPDKYSYSRYGIRFDSCSDFSIRNFDWAKYVIGFEGDMGPSVQIDNKSHKKCI